MTPRFRYSWLCLDSISPTPEFITRIFKAFNNIQFVQYLLKRVVLKEIVVLHLLLNVGKIDQSNKLHEKLSTQACFGRNQSSPEIQLFFQITKGFLDKMVLMEASIMAKRRKPL